MRFFFLQALNWELDSKSENKWDGKDLPFQRTSCQAYGARYILWDLGNGKKTLLSPFPWKAECHKVPRKKHIACVTLPPSCMLRMAKVALCHLGMYLSVSQANYRPSILDKEQIGSTTNGSLQILSIYSLTACCGDQFPYRLTSFPQVQRNNTFLVTPPCSSGLLR